MSDRLERDGALCTAGGCGAPAVFLIGYQPRCSRHASPNPPRTPAAGNAPAYPWHPTEDDKRPTCLECGANIASDTATCPRCGAFRAGIDPPRTPAAEQQRAEGPYVTGLPPDQMTALERQLTEKLKLVEGEAAAVSAEVERLRADLAVVLDAEKIALRVLGEELAAQRVVVEAARRYTSAQRMNAKDSYQMFHDLYAALDALDAAHAAPDGTG